MQGCDRMRVPDSLILPLFLIATAAGGLSHRRVGPTPSDRIFSAGFTLALLSMVAMFALLISSIVWPRWTMRGPIFLAVALVELAAGAWLWRDRIRHALKRFD